MSDLPPIISEEGAKPADRVDHVLAEIAVILRELILSNGRVDLLARLEALGELGSPKP